MDLYKEFFEFNITKMNLWNYLAEPKPLVI